MSQEKLIALGEPERLEPFDADERAVLRLADAMVRTPCDIPDALFAELREHFEDGQLVELTSALAWENYRARFNRVFDVESEGYSEGAVCPLPIRTGGPREA